MFKKNHSALERIENGKLEIHEIKLMFSSPQKLLDFVADEKTQKELKVIAHLKFRQGK